MPGRFSRVGPYIIMDTIGAGSSSKVKICVHAGTHARYACKVIDKSLIRERMFNVQVQREIAIMSMLRHVNTVSLVSVHSTATKVFIVMELVAGCEIFYEIKRLSRFTEPQARFYFRQLIDGLRYCHSHGIFHRDLKPDNVLLNRTHVVKITDFGLATLKAGAAADAESVTDSLNLHTRCGTPNYAAPEIINMNPNGYSGAKVDVWSCGVILYVFVSGLLPFDADTLEELFRDIVHCDITYPAWFSDSLKDLLRNILKTDPAERYSLTDIQQHPWYTDPEAYSTGGIIRPVHPLAVAITPAELEPSPIYPFPKEGSSASAGKSNKGQNWGSRDSLDFGTREHGVINGLTMADLPKSLQYIRDPTHATSAGSIVGPNTSENADMNQPKYPPPGDSDDLKNGENGQENSHENATSECGSDEVWVLSDADRVVWYQTIKDIDMVPAVFEFGADSTTLSERWQKVLAKENIRNKSSFAVNRFGVRRNIQSPSAQHLPSPATRFEAETLREPEDISNARETNPVFSEQPRSVSGASVITAEKSARSEKRRSGPGSDMKHEGLPGQEGSVVPLQVNATHQVEHIQDAQQGLLAPCALPKPSFPQASDKRIPAGHLSSEVQLNEPHTERALPDHMMGAGRDLLQDSNTLGELGEEPTVPPRDNQELDLPTELELPSTSESRDAAHIVSNDRSLGTKVSLVPANIISASAPRQNSTSVNVGQRATVLSPFAFDVPGPRRALPVTKTLLGSIVRSAVSPKRLLRRSSTSRSTRSCTQFHSLLDPSACFDVIQSVLREYGCSVIKFSSPKSREKFQIRCESTREDATVHARLSIYKVDDVLCTVQFKRLLHTDIKEFARFYSDISRLYSKALKERGLSEDSAKKERRTKKGTKPRFESSSCDNTVGVG